MSSFASLTVKLDNTMGGGAGDVTTAANIGTSAGGAVTLGSTSQNLTIQGNPAGAMNIGTNLTTGNISIGTNVASGGAVNIGNSAGGITRLNFVYSISGAPTNAMSLYNNMTSGTVNFATTLTTGTLNINTASTGASTVNIGNVTNGTTNIIGTLNLGSTTKATTINGSSLTFGGLNGNVSSTAVLANAPVRNLPQVKMFTIFGETTAVTAPATPVVQFRLPFPWKILGVRASLYTAGSSATTIDIRSVASGTNIPTTVAGGTSIFTTTLTLASGYNSSIGCPVNPVLTTAANSTGLADDTGLAVFVTSAGTSAAGLKLYIYYTTF